MKLSTIKLIVTQLTAASAMALVSPAMASDASAYVAATEKDNRVSFWIKSRTTPGVVNYYSCDLVESIAEDMLESLGATDVSARCSGGIDNGFGFPREAYLRVSFKSVVSSADGTLQAEFSPVSIKGRQNCELATQIMKEIKPQFEIKNVVARKCRGGDNDSYKFNLEVLKAR